ncbi:MAG: nickel-dependent lactate racemase [Candidatus Methanofastidiosia archaeon]
MKLKIPYGKNEVEVEILKENLGEFVYPNEVEIKNEEKVILKALKNPLSSESFDEFLSNSRDILFIVNDATRPTPTAKILEVLYERIKNLNFKFLIATGTHRAPTQDELKFIFGEHLNDFRERIYIHDAKKSQMMYIGTSKNGTELYLNEMVLKAHKLCIISSVEPHYFAGFTGGRKSLFPGVAAFSSIEQNHKIALMPESKTLKLNGNPVHEDMMDALKAFERERIFSLTTVLDRNHRIYSAFGGNLELSFKKACERAKKVYGVRISEKSDIVVTVASYPMDVDLYQSQKALDNGKLALKEGGILILVSKCREGIGDETFLKLLKSSKTPQGVLEKIKENYLLGYHKAAKITEIATWALMWGVTELDDEVLEKAFIMPYESLQKALDEALKIKKDARILFLMDGSLVVPLIETK